MNIFLLHFKKKEKKKKKCIRINSNEILKLSYPYKYLKHELSFVLLKIIHFKMFLNAVCGFGWSVNNNQLPVK